MLVPHPPKMKANGPWADGKAVTFGHKGGAGRWETIGAQPRAACPDGKQKTQAGLWVFWLNDHIRKQTGFLTLHLIKKNSFISPPQIKNGLNNCNNPLSISDLSYAQIRPILL